jgi:hypothetical protein
MKTLRFTTQLKEEILAGTKTGTWRLFDEKDLQVGDEVELAESGSNEVFAHAIIDQVVEKTLGELTGEDILGKYISHDEMYGKMKVYYGDKVTPETIVKMVGFKLI